MQCDDYDIDVIVLVLKSIMIKKYVYNLSIFHKTEQNKGNKNRTRALFHRYRI